MNVEVMSGSMRKHGGGTGGIAKPEWGCQCQSQNFHVGVDCLEVSFSQSDIETKRTFPVSTVVFGARIPATNLTPSFLI